MLVAAHLVRLAGDLSDRVEQSVAAVRSEVLARHEPCCAAVDVDLSEVVRLPGTLVTHLRHLRTEGHRCGVVLSVTAPRHSPAHRVLEFHRSLGEALPLTYTGHGPDPRPIA